MKVLVAEDDPVSRTILSAQLTRLGHEVAVAEDGTQAWARFVADPIECVVTDWMMPGIDGLELCRRIRAGAARPWAYVLLLTGREGRESLLEGLEAGADEFMSKPPDVRVLQARLHVAQRLLGLEQTLRDRVASLEKALEEVKRLRGILPICMYCKQIQTGPDAWKGVELYVSEHSDASFSHGVCPRCNTTILQPQLDELRTRPRVPPPQRPTT